MREMTSMSIRPKSSFKDFFDELKKEIEEENKKNQKKVRFSKKTETKKIKRPLGRKKTFRDVLRDFADELNDSLVMGQGKNIENPTPKPQPKAKEEGDLAAYHRQKEKDAAKKQEKIKKEIARENRNKKLRQAVLMAKILDKPVSKRRSRLK